jgi:transposase
MYTQTMASFQRFTVKGQAYWRIVESRRVNGKPRPVPVAYLGKADDLLARLRQLDSLRVRSLSHGAVAALVALAQQLDLCGAIDRQLAAGGRRVRPCLAAAAPSPPAPPLKADGLSVGTSLTLASIGRACHPTSKRAFAAWAQTTTLGELLAVPVTPLTSQHFWDQMDQVPLEAMPLIEKLVVTRAIALFQLPLDTLLFDGTNFFTFIASSNRRADGLAARGKNKQKRVDLRQVSLALLCSRATGVPLWHLTYAGNVADAKCFAEVLPLVKKRIEELGAPLQGLTLVYDKGNVSRVNQHLVDESQLHYVSALTTASQKSLVSLANSQLEPVPVREEVVQAYRTTRQIWGAERTVVVYVSERLRAGQLQGIRQHLRSARKWLDDLAATLARGTQRRDRARIERDIETRLKGRQFLNQILRFELLGTDPKLSLTYAVDEAALQQLAAERLGRVVLMTNRHEWPTAEIIQAYHSQADVEAAFRDWKNVDHIAVRPQFHWTVQKLHVHNFICFLSYLLAKLLLLKAQRAGQAVASIGSLLTRLADVRRATVVRCTDGGKPRVSTMLEEMAPDLVSLCSALDIR